jgi:hypothetical protein
MTPAHHAVARSKCGVLRVLRVLRCGGLQILRGHRRALAGLPKQRARSRHLWSQLEETASVSSVTESCAGPLRPAHNVPLLAPQVRFWTHADAGVGATQWHRWHSDLNAASAIGSFVLHLTGDKGQSLGHGVFTEGAAVTVTVSVIPW